MLTFSLFFYYQTVITLFLGIGFGFGYTDPYLRPKFCWLEKIWVFGFSIGYKYPLYSSFLSFEYDEYSVYASPNPVPKFC
jgi:hypothetical protein